MFVFVATYTHKENHIINSDCLGVFTNIKDAFRTVINFLFENKIVWYNFYDKIKYYNNEVEYLIADDDKVFNFDINEGDLVAGYRSTEDIITRNYYLDIYSKYPNKGEHLSFKELKEKIIDVITKSLFNNEDDLIKWCKSCCPYFEEKWNISITEHLIN